MNTSSTSMARARQRVERMNKRAVPRPRLRKRVRPHRRQSTVLNAIPGTGGLIGNLAKKLNCSYNSIVRALEQPGWENVRDALKEEKAVALDRCVQNIFTLANFSVDDSTRLRASAMLLEKLHPEWGNVTRVSVEGEINHDHRHVHAVIQIPADFMNLPVSERLALLELIDRKEQQLASND